MSTSRFPVTTWCIILTLVLPSLAASAAAEQGAEVVEADGDQEKVLVVEQDYNLIQQDDKGVGAKDIRQTLYFTADYVRINEYNGRNKQPTETILIDFKKQLIINLDHEKISKVTETFARRRERIEDRRKKAEKDLKGLVGAQKEKTEKLYRGLLDKDRKFEMVRPKEDAEKEILGVKAKRVQVIDDREKDYVAVESFLHPDLELPCDNTEVLYLLQLIGENLNKFLHKNTSVFRALPLEMKLVLAAGGSAETKVTKVEWVDRDKLSETLFQVAPAYKEVKRFVPPKPKIVDPD